ncbi:MAG: hypothetical protein MRK01_00110 [Candidatus Scalindua sp.]|nr:hypothetical protein [Candidatus Scalindua sp.]
MRGDETIKSYLKRYKNGGQKDLLKDNCCLNENTQETKWELLLNSFIVVPTKLIIDCAPPLSNPVSHQDDTITLCEIWSKYQAVWIFHYGRFKVSNSRHKQLNLKTIMRLNKSLNTLI